MLCQIGKSLLQSSGSRNKACVLTSVCLERNWVPGDISHAHYRPFAAPVLRGLRRVKSYKGQMLWHFSRNTDDLITAGCY